MDTLGDPMSRVSGDVQFAVDARSIHRGGEFKCSSGGSHGTSSLRYLYLRFYIRNARGYGYCARDCARGWRWHGVGATKLIGHWCWLQRHRD